MTVASSDSRSGIRNAFGADDPRRLAILRILFCVVVIASSPPVAISILLYFVLLGVLGRVAAAGALGAVAFYWTREPEAMAAYERIRLAMPLAIFVVSRTWDAYSFDSLCGLFFSGNPDDAILKTRSEKGVYAWPVIALCLFAIGYLASGTFGWGTLLSPWDALWILPLAIPIEKGFDALARATRGLFTDSRRFIIYDGDCGFCTRTRMVIERLDSMKLLEFVDFRRELDSVPEEYRRDLTPEDCEAEMVASSKGGNHPGFFGFRAMAWFLPAVWPIAPLLYLPGVAPVGVRVYRWVADNRLRIRLRNMEQCRP